MIGAIMPVAILATTLGQQAAPAVTLPASLSGEWTLVAERAFGQLMTDGKEATLSLSESNREPVAQRYRIAGKQGEAFTFEQIGQAPTAERSDAEERPSLFPLRAYLLSVSPSVALWWQPHRAAFLAYRKQTIPARFRGSYVAGKRAKGVDAIELGADTLTVIGRGMPDNDPPEEAGEDDDSGEGEGHRVIPVLAVAAAGGESLRLVLGEGAHGDRLHIEIHGQRATLVRERFDEPESKREVKFVPAQPDKKVAEELKAPGKPSEVPGNRTELPLGLYRLSSLSNNDESLAVVSGVAWSIFPFSGSRGTVFYGEVVGVLGENTVRMRVAGDGERYHLLLHRLPGDSFLVELNGKLLLLHRWDTPPLWAPTAGLSADVKLLCRELVAAGPSLDESALGAAFRRTGMAARSDLMRSLVEVLAQVPHERRAAVLDLGLKDAGEPLPDCSGVDRLRALPGQVRGE